MNPNKKTVLVSLSLETDDELALDVAQFNRGKRRGSPEFVTKAQRVAQIVDAYYNNKKKKNNGK
mgnify:CR=1 FL=1